MARQITARIERFAVRGAFVIARGAKTHVDVVVAEVRDGAHLGRGEGTPVYYRGDSADAALAAIETQADAIAAGATRADLLTLMPAGAARNALDSALWDLEAKSTGVPVWQTARPAAAAAAADRLYDQPRRTRRDGGGGARRVGP